MASLKNRLGCGLVVAGGALVLVLFVQAVARSVEHPAPEAPAASSSGPVSPADAPVEAKGSRALLDGLGPGDRIAGWRIHRTRLVDGKRLAIDVWQGKTGFTVWVAKKGSGGGKIAPAQTDKYDFYVGEARTYGGPVPAGAENKVLDAIVARVKRAESKVPVPPGL